VSIYVDYIGGHMAACQPSTLSTIARQNKPRQRES